MAADKGHSAAQCHLGICYTHGYGVEKNEKQAFNWFLESAQQGDSQAQLALGLCYDTGIGVDKDAQQAFNWYLKSAQQGDSQAQFNVGISYYTGDGVYQDQYQAFDWYLKSAQQGYAPAQYRVGMCYKKGKGVEENLSEAVHWFKKASEQGDDRAKNILEGAFDTTKETEQSNLKSLRTNMDDTIPKAFKEYIEGQQTLFQAKIDLEIKGFQNEKATIIEKTKQDIEKNNAVLLEHAKKEVEKQGNFSLALFTGVSIAITLAFIGVMASFSTSSFDGLRSELQAQFDSPKLKIEQIEKLQTEVESLKAKLTVLEEKNTKPTPTQKH
jgi:TPR repeat protein